MLICGYIGFKMRLTGFFLSRVHYSLALPKIANSVSIYGSSPAITLYSTTVPNQMLQDKILRYTAMYL